MRTMKTYIYALLFLFVGVSLFVLMSRKTFDKIYVDDKRSYYCDFVVENDKVYIRYYITLTNKFDVEKVVNLSTKLPEDVTIGLLKNEEIKALDEDGLEKAFILPPNSSKSFDVVFVGEFSGTNQKYDRSLSKINVSVVE